MNTVCEVCGDIGFEHLLLCCSGCNGSATHQYCLDKVLYDASLEDWFCDQCRQRHSECNYTRSPGKLSSEMLSSHAYFGSTSEQPITKSVESAMVVGPWGPQKRNSKMAKSACLKKTNSFQKKSNTGGKGIKKRGGNTVSVACTSGKTLLHPCQTIGTKIAKNNKDRNRQVDNENSVQTLNNDRHSLKAKGSPNPRLALTLECNQTTQSDLESNIRKFPFSVGEVAVNQVAGSKDDSAETLSPKHTDHDKQSNDHDAVVKNIKVSSGKDKITVAGAHQNKYLVRNKDKPVAHGDINSNVLDDTTLGRKKKEVRFQLDHEASNELQQRSMDANIPQPSTKQNNTLDKAISDSSNMGVLPKENNCLPSMCIENHNMKEYHIGPSKLLDQTYSSSSLEISLKEKSVPEASSTEVEISDVVQNFGKDIPRKRRRLLLYDDDDDEKEEKAEDVQQENINPQAHKCDEPKTKVRIDSENYVEEGVWTGDSNDQNLMNGRPVKRRYIDEIKDEGDILGTANTQCVLNDAANWSLNGGAKMVSQPSVATDHPLQSRPSDSESVYQQYCFYSQPLDEPIWSGVFKIDTEVFLKLDAHLSTKACQRVWELARLLQPVVEVMKLPRSQAWPKSWTSSGPTDGSIGLFFFPHSSRQNDVSNRLVSRIIKSDCALKVVVGIAELLIFPSLLLPKQYHVFQGKYYLWGVFRRRTFLLDGGVQAEEQDGSMHPAKEAEQDGSVHAVEEGKQEQDLKDQQQGLLDQQADILYESFDQETSFDQESPVMKHYVHVENQLVECNPKAQEEPMKVATGEGITSPLSSPKAGSNCFVQPRTESKLHALGDVDHHEDFTSSTEWNASCAIERSSDSGPPAVTTNLIKHADHGHGQPPSSSEPPTTKLFGFVAARTPRAQQLIQEMASEGALLFPVAEENVVAADSTTGSSTGIISELNSDNECLCVCEPPQTFDFVSMGHSEPGADSEACLELFPVREEQIGWAPRVEVSGEVDLNLSIGKQSQAPSFPPLF